MKGGKQKRTVAGTVVGAGVDSQWSRLQRERICGPVRTQSVLYAGVRTYSLMSFNEPV